MNDCRMYTEHGCVGLTTMLCKQNKPCPFYKDEDTYRMERRHTTHRLKKLGLTHLLRRKDHE